MAVALRDLQPQQAPPSAAAAPAAASEAGQRPRVVIVGAGFGGLAAATGLRNAGVDVTVIDRRNYHLFQPLLYQVATAALSPAAIAQPIRSILKRQRNAAVLLGRVTGIDTSARAVLIGERRIPYDYLIVATGARHAYFGHDEWEPFAPGLKKIEDATAIRARILLAFEQAESAADPALRRALLTFAIVGGGPTGVELAGAIAELARQALAADFRAIDPRAARVVLIEAGPRLQPAFCERLSAVAKRALERLGVEVRLGAAVTACDGEGVALGEERLAARCVIWAAGVAASPAGKWLGAERDRAGRVKVERDLSVPGHPEVCVIGDSAFATDAKGHPLPGIAPAAKQAGRYVAELIRARVEGRAAPAPFRYRHLGNLATIGRKAAVAEFGRIRLSPRRCSSAASPTAPRRRPGWRTPARTLKPLLRKFVLAVLVVVWVMIALAAVGIDIGPLLAGAGVVGIALGFGAQSLVCERGRQSPRSCPAIIETRRQQHFIARARPSKPVDVPGRRCDPIGPAPDPEADRPLRSR